MDDEGGGGGCLGMIMIIVVGGAMLLFGGGACMFFGSCMGLGYAVAPNPELASIDAEAAKEFVIDTQPSAETGRDVYLEFETEYELPDASLTGILDETPPPAVDGLAEGDGEVPPLWGLEGWVEIEGMEFEVDLAPGRDGIKGHPTEWELTVSETEGRLWGTSRGELLLGTVPPGAANGQVKGMVWGLPGTYITKARVFVRE